MFESCSEFTNYVPLDYLVDKVFDIADSAVASVVGVGSAAVYAFFK